MRTMAKKKVSRKKQFLVERESANKLQHSRQLDDESSAENSSGTYGEMVQEVEKVSEMLAKTQTKLWKSQVELKDYNTKTEALIGKLEQQRQLIDNLEQDNQLLRENDGAQRDEMKRLNQEIVDRDECRTRPELERRLRKAVELLQKDLDSSRERNENAQARIQDLEKKSKELEEAAEDQQGKARSSNVDLSACKKELRDAKESNAYLIEQVAKLRDELQSMKEIYGQKDILIRREIEGKVKDKIRLELRNSITQNVTDKVTRDVSSRLKSEHNKEIDILREKLKNIVKENSILKSRIGGAVEKETEARELEDTVESLKYEIRKLESILDETQREQELHISKLESNHRMQLHDAKEEAAREKWEYISEVRKQMNVEREREIDAYSERIEALSKETDYLLERAVQEKEEYGAHIKKRIQEEKDREIRLLQEKVETRNRERDRLVREAREEQEALELKLRKDFEQERSQEINISNQQIEELRSEKESLEKRVADYEEELELTLQENESHIEKMKAFQSDMKVLEEENLKLKRKNQNLSTVANRYKHDAEEAASEMLSSKRLFREALLKSESQSESLKAKLSHYESMTRDSKQSRSAEDDGDSGIHDKGRLEILERENRELVARNKQLSTSLQERTKEISIENESIRTENSDLKQKILVLSNQDSTEEQENGAKNDAELANKLETQDALLEQYRSDIQRIKLTTSQTVEKMKVKFRESNRLIEQYRAHRNEATKELARAKQMAENALTLASEDDTEHLHLEIRALRQILDVYATETLEPLTSNHATSSGRTDDTKDDHLLEEMHMLELLLSEIQLEDSDVFKDDTKSEHSFSITSMQSELEVVKRGKSVLQDKIFNMKRLLEKYRSELAQTSVELEDTKETLALEGEVAEQMNQRVQSLNLLLKTTEEIHAEDTRELEKSHKRVDEAVIESKKEIDRLITERSELQMSLLQSQEQLQRAKEVLGQENQNILVKYQEANKEVLELRSKVDALECKIRAQNDQYDRVSFELKHTKRLFNDALVRSEKEVLKLKQQMELLAEANAKYDAVNRMIQKKNRDLEESLLEVQEEHKKQLKDSEEEIDGLRMLISSTEVSSNDALGLEHETRENEERRQHLKRRSKQTHSSLVFDERNGQNYTRKLPTSSQQNERFAHSPMDEDEESSSKILQRLNSLFEDKTKKVTWKDSEWEPDGSTITTNTSFASPMSSIELRNEVASSRKHYNMMSEDYSLFHLEEERINGTLTVGEVDYVPDDRDDYEAPTEDAMMKTLQRDKRTKGEQHPRRQLTSRGVDPRDRKGVKAVPEVDDDSTLGWSIQQSDDTKEFQQHHLQRTLIAPDMETSGARSRGTENQRQQRQLAQETNMQREIELLRASSSILSGVDGIKESESSSVSSAFSYSSNDSATDDKDGIEARQPQDATAAFPKQLEYNNAVSTTLNEDSSSDGSNPRHGNPGYQRAFQKVSQRNWTKEERIQFKSSKKSGRSEQNHVARSQPERKEHAATTPTQHLEAE